MVQLTHDSDANVKCANEMDNNKNRRKAANEMVKGYNFERYKAK